VLVVQHEEANSVGLVLNHASVLSVEDLHIGEDTKRCFGHTMLRLGGRSCHQSVLLLHGESRVSDAHSVCPGLYTGGLNMALNFIRNGVCTADRFCLLAGYTSWQPGQLEWEVSTGAWIPVSASPRLVLDLACDEARCSTAWHDMFSYVSEPERSYLAVEE
jgi:putative transcriptional regulator